MNTKKSPGNSSPKLPIILVGKEKSLLTEVEQILRSEGMDSIKKYENKHDLEKLLSNTGVSLLIVDTAEPESAGDTPVRYLSNNFPGVPVLAITASGDVETIVKIMRAGAFDIIVKPVRKTRLIPVVKRSLELNVVGDEKKKLKKYLLSNVLENPEAFSSIIGQNAAMRAIFRYAEAIATTHLPVLITGETGTGKELIARAIHTLSKRGGVFVAENVAGLDDQLFSDTLFGHNKGAFTGAENTRSGLIEKAHGGTFFLDEIGDLAVESQIKLLRLLQEKQYYPLGSDIPKYTDTRIIVATHRNLEEMVEENRFRKDLFYRLQTHHIHLPPLRERKDDIRILIHHFIQKAAAELKKKVPTPAPELVTLLRTYSFPGNIRELEGMIFDAVSLHRRGILSLDPFRDKINPRMHHIPELDPSEQFDFITQDFFPTLKEAEFMLIAEALRRAEGNQVIASQLLGITRRALNNRLQRLKK